MQRHAAPCRWRAHRGSVMTDQPKGACFLSTSDKLLSVLDLFDLEKSDWSVEEAAAALGLATSTTYRYFASLTAAGILAPFVPSRYVLGPTIIKYDRQLRLTDPLISAAQPELQRIAQTETGDRVIFLCRLLGGQVMCVDQAVSGEPHYAVSYERGRPMPLFTGSASKAILAHLPPRQLRSLHQREPERFAAAGLGDNWDEVRGVLKAIRNARHVVSLGEVDPDMKGISVPIVDADSAILASLSIATPAATVSADQAEHMIMSLIEAAGRIEAALAKRAGQRSAN